MGGCLRACQRTDADASPSAGTFHACGGGGLSSDRIVFFQERR